MTDNTPSLRELVVAGVSGFLVGVVLQRWRGSSLERNLAIQAVSTAGTVFGYRFARHCIPDMHI